MYVTLKPDAVYSNSSIYKPRNFALATCTICDPLREKGPLHAKIDFEKITTKGR